MRTNNAQELQEALEAAQEETAAAQESVEEEQRAHLQFVMRVREHHRLEHAAMRKRCQESVGQYKVCGVLLNRGVATPFCTRTGEGGTCAAQAGQGAHQVRAAACTMCRTGTLAQPHVKAHCGHKFFPLTWFETSTAT